MTFKKYYLLYSFLFFLTSCFDPGSYPYAEIYPISVKEETLIAAILKFKNTNIQFQVPTEVNLKDGVHNDYWHHFYFYYPAENEILSCWTRSNGNNKTNFAFEAINQGLILGKWKVINKDYNKKENAVEKKKFETRILNKIIEDLSQ